MEVPGGHESKKKEIMIYGYLRVSTDEQDVNSQRQGVDEFAARRGWTIETYITDEGVSGGKNPDKRNLGPLLKKLQKEDILISSEISRLGRDLYMVMDILHFCMERGVVIYTVKDNFVLGDSIQSKVLAFAFGLSAEIERQMIRQRTREGLRLRMKSGVLLGRPIGRATNEECMKYAEWKDRFAQMVEWGMLPRQIAAVVGCDRNTVNRLASRWGLGGKAAFSVGWAEKAAGKKRANKTPPYKDGPYKVVPLDRARTLELIDSGCTVPEIAEQMPEYTYEQVYDSILCDAEFNALYRMRAQMKLVKGKR